MKSKLLILLMAISLLTAGCNPASRAKEWAEQAVAQTWVAQYRITFHQQDEDLVMNVREERGETLVLDITMPNGSLRLEYGADNLLIDLDRGGLVWEDFARQAPYYTLSELSRQIVAAGELNNKEDWAEVLGYYVQVKNGMPALVRYQSEWTLEVEYFRWNEAGS